MEAELVQMSKLSECHSSSSGVGWKPIELKVDNLFALVRKD